MAEKDKNDRLIELVRARDAKMTEFNYGILTADRYVKTLRECVGLEACYKFACARNTSFNDVMRKASQTLAYSNPEMLLDVKGTESTKDVDVELPKNTLMVFRHTLTTPRKDRDGDILRTQGAVIDPKLPLLWQHVHTLPIGKMLAVHEHNSKRLKVISAIIDINSVAHDAAVMVDNGMGRFSHGFRALEFTEMKATDGSPTNGGGGFDVKKFEIMEESLVSVPSNIDAEEDEILLSLVEGGKLSSPLMKSYGKAIRSKRPVSVQIEYKEKVGDWERTIVVPNAADFETVFNSTKAKEDETENKASHKCTCSDTGASSASKETDAKEDTGEKDANDTEVKKAKKPMCPDCDVPLDKNGVCPECGYEEEPPEEDEEMEEDEKAYKEDDGEEEICPECGSKMKDGMCKKCGYEMKDDKSFDSVKQGRVLSKSNENKIRNAKESIDEATGMDGLSRACRALMKEASSDLGGVLSALGESDELETQKDVTVPEAMGLVLAKATSIERSRMLAALKALESTEAREQKVGSYLTLTKVKSK